MSDDEEDEEKPQGPRPMAPRPGMAPRPRPGMSPRPRPGMAPRPRPPMSDDEEDEEKPQGPRPMAPRPGMSPRPRSMSPRPRPGMGPRPRPGMGPRPQGMRNPFVITPVELQKYKTLFKEYDDANTGYIEGSVAAEYLSQSALPQPILSKIWQLADTDEDGMLNEYEFIVATHITKLVQKLVVD